ncbi:agmatine deiminase family protein [Spirochaeta africana]|uniref:Peptidylarginine deiminase-like enzyme n=1 Tax=Spirochaeta africana (strain ATCC 700263 / DSM 8902 / Z-7692) TaxID=889378 RepID=H9UGE4_SPIAZ|nr:agmatine deiminase family protein [Spirochaeta africana]AFG36587.1 peptidylarginine deiminase-like enzyme [Spirochaeta africana DSM 8902]
MNLHPRRLPAEWEPVSGVLLAWPDTDTDWRHDLAAAQRCVAAIVRELSQEQPVLLAVNNLAQARRDLLAYGVDPAVVRLYQVPINDTWTRDYGPITVLQRPDGQMQETPLLLDWVFNGWGMKFPADRDNLVTRRLAVAGAFARTPMETVPFVLEGGSIESDGRGTVLTTAQCLLDYNRSPNADLAVLEQRLRRYLGAERVLWLQHGRLIGDDTDAHIDTLVRFCDPETIAYTVTGDPDDEHYSCLQALQQELRELRTAAGDPYRLVPLPLPSALYAADGHRLPATYANFLITNHSVWVPQYGVPEDHQAFSAMIGLFPGRSIRGVDCLPLIHQHGSLHCITMQLPEGVIHDETEHAHE